MPDLRTKPRVSQFKLGYRIVHNEEVTHTVTCPHCPNYSATVKDYDLALQIMNSHACTAHGEFDTDIQNEIGFATART